jgi:hypothetical protein
LHSFTITAYFGSGCFTTGALLDGIRLIGNFFGGIAFGGTGLLTSPT